ncbi:MAG: preprotein translocase subunit SecG [Elusimicrobiota bacterium]|jgi:preprotein translocase subunit SecG
MAHTILVVVHVLACVVLILTVLVQGGRGAGLMVFGGGGDLINTPSGTTFIKKFTGFVAGVFALTSLFLSLMSARSSMTSVTSKVPYRPAPISAPAAPGAEEGGAAQAAPADAGKAAPAKKSP